MYRLITKLNRAQQAWVGYRDAQCRYEASGHPGMMGGSDIIACTADMDRARAQYLKDEVDRWSQ